jgi:hypothetical protein
MDRREKKELLKQLRCGVRLQVKPPKTETPKTVYSRKREKKRRFDENSSFFYFHAPAYGAVIQKSSVQYS